MTFRLKVAIYTEQRLDAGGGFNESLSVIDKFKNHFNGQIDLMIFSGHAQSLAALEYDNVSVIQLKISKIQKVFLFLRHHILMGIANVIPSNNSIILMLRKRLLGNNSFEKQFIKHDVDLVFFPSPEPMAKYLEELNFGMCVWDLAHREIPFLPELRNSFILESRNNYYDHVIPRALFLLVGHELCRSQLQAYYSIPKHRIILMPFSPAKSILKSYGSDFEEEELKCLATNKFIFYPAQYWAHKNHRFLIDVLKHYIDLSDPNLKLVFTGTDKGNLTFLKEYVTELDLSASVIFCGFVSSEDIRLLYEKCAAVMVPSFIGPGTLPTLEGLVLNALVIVEDTTYNRDFYGPDMTYQSFDCPRETAKDLELILTNYEEKNEKNALVLNHIANLSEHEALNKVFKRNMKFLKSFRRVE